MLSVGLDAHKNWYVAAILDEGKQHVKTVTARSVDQLIGRLRKASKGEPYQIAFEASTDYGWLYRCLRGAAARVVVAHPGRLKLISQSRQKNDRSDALKLAQLLAVDLLPTVHVPGPKVQGWRRLIQTRNRRVADRTKAKQRLRALLRASGIKAPRSLWSKDGLAWLRAVSWPTEYDATEAAGTLADLDHADRQVRELTRELDRIGRQCPAVILLRTIPGIGARTAEALAAWIDDPHRFRRVKDVGAYVGLTPCQDQSGKSNRLGHITREGPSILRKLLVEAAHVAIRCDATLRSRYERIVGEDAGRRKIAVVAMARHLATVALAMLKSGEAWRGGAGDAAKPKSKSKAKAKSKSKAKAKAA